MPLRPLTDKVIGVLEEEDHGGHLIVQPWKHKSQYTLRVKAVGNSVREVFVDDIVLLHPEFYGTVVVLADDETNEATTYHVVEEKFLMATFRES